MRLTTPFGGGAQVTCTPPPAASSPCSVTARGGSAGVAETSTPSVSVVPVPDADAIVVALSVDDVCVDQPIRAGLDRGGPSEDDRSTSTAALADGSAQLSLTSPELTVAWTSAASNAVSNGPDGRRRRGEPRPLGEHRVGHRQPGINRRIDLGGAGRCPAHSVAVARVARRALARARKTR